MKSLRIWVLVLLAFVLPMRGAMAAAMLCATAPGHVHSHADAGHDEAASHAHATHAVHEHGPGVAHDAGDKCSVCASCCSVTAPASVSVVMVHAPPAAADFPSHTALAAEFISAGQERPPRSI